MFTPLIRFLWKLTGIPGTEIFGESKFSIILSSKSNFAFNTIGVSNFKIIENGNSRLTLFFLGESKLKKSIAGKSIIFNEV